MANETIKNIVALYDKVCEHMSNNSVYADVVGIDTVDGKAMQNANNIYWRNVQQQAPTITGWDMTGNETSIIELGYPMQLSDPRNDFVEIRVDELRDEGFMERRALASATRQNAELNKRLADLAADEGSLYYESSSADFDFVAEADTILTEQGAYDGMGRSFMLTPRNNQLMAGNLASRTLFPNNRSEETYSSALIGKNVAGFDLFRAPTYGTVPTAAGADSTVASDVTEVPESFTSTGGTIASVDYRVGTVSLVSAANYQVGDVVTFGTAVNSLNASDKTDTGQLKTFKIVAINGNDISVYPKPIAANQAGITTEQAAYANISTAIVATDACTKVNANGGQANAFFCNDAIEIVNGDAPFERLNELDGMEIVSTTLDNGVKLHMAYDANLATVNARMRIFTWYGLCMKDPERAGVAIKI